MFNMYKFKKMTSLFVLLSIIFTTLFSYPIFASDVTITLNYSEVSVEEGGTVQLTATTDPAGLDIDWYCGDGDAEVSANGLVTGITAGEADIIVTAWDDLGNEYTAYCTVYVYKPDGVYYIRNLHSTDYLNVLNGGITNGTNVNLTSKVSTSSSDPVKARQMWITHYLGEGFYSISPLHKPDMGLNVSNNNVNIVNLGVMDSLNNISSSARWTFSVSGSGFLITNNDSRYLTMQAENGSTANGANVVATTYYNGDNCRWTFEPILNPPSGMYWYDTVNSEIISNPIRYIAPNESLDISSFGIQAVMYSPDYKYQGFHWTSNDESIATVFSKNGAITGVSGGTTTITAIHGQLHGYSLSYTIKVTEFANGTYYINNKENGCFVSMGDSSKSSNLGTTVCQWGFKDVAAQKWNLTHLGNGYYSIKSARTDGHYYLAVSGNSTSSGANIVYASSADGDGAKWRIEATDNNAYKIMPKCGESGNLVLCATTPSQTDGYTFKQYVYLNNNSYKEEWRIVEGIQVTAIGVPDNRGHSFNETLDTAIDTFSDMGYCSYYKHEGELSKQDFLEYLQNSEIFYIVTHGSPTSMNLNQSGNNCITLNDIQSLSDGALSNCKLVIYGSCSTSLGGGDGNNLLTATVAKGAQTVVGFEEKIYISDYISWINKFLEELADGETVSNAIDITDNYMRNSCKSQTILSSTYAGIDCTITN